MFIGLNPRKYDILLLFTMEIDRVAAGFSLRL